MGSQESTDRTSNRIVQCEEGHLFCVECFNTLAEHVIGQGRYLVTCVDQSQCSASFSHSQQIKFLTNGTLVAIGKLEAADKIAQAKITGLYECPYCGNSRIDEDNGHTLYECPEPACRRTTCKLCRKDAHGSRACGGATDSSVQGARHRIAEHMTAALVRTCNNSACRTPFLKESGCNKMTCPKCLHRMCYVCRKSVKDYNHFGLDCPLFDDFEARHNNDITAAQESAVLAEAQAIKVSDAQELQIDRALVTRENRFQQTHHGIVGMLQERPRPRALPVRANHNNNAAPNLGVNRVIQRQIRRPEEAGQMAHLRAMVAARRQRGLLAQRRVPPPKSAEGPLMPQSTKDAQNEGSSTMPANVTTKAPAREPMRFKRLPRQDHENTPGKTPSPQESHKKGNKEVAAHTQTPKKPTVGFSAEKKRPSPPVVLSRERRKMRHWSAYVQKKHTSGAGSSSVNEAEGRACRDVRQTSPSLLGEAMSSPVPMRSSPVSSTWARHDLGGLAEWSGKLPGNVPEAGAEDIKRSRRKTWTSRAGEDVPPHEAPDAGLAQALSRCADPGRSILAIRREMKKETREC